MSLSPSARTPFFQAVYYQNLGQALLELAGLSAQLNSSEIASQAVSPASHFLPISRNSCDRW